MSELTNWNNIDSVLEEKVIKIGGNTVRFIRPKNVITYSLSCKHCKNIISSVEDVEALKSHDCCETCYLNYNYKNSHSLEKAVMPEINTNE